MGSLCYFFPALYGMETDAKVREHIRQVLTAGINLTATGQSDQGGWIYWPGGGDEGSVTVTQMQGLRASHEAGLTVPKQTIAKAIHYLEMCKMPDGGICYPAGNSNRFASVNLSCRNLLSVLGRRIRLAASQGVPELRAQADGAAIGQDAAHWEFRPRFLHLTSTPAQAFYQAGDKYWDEYFPPTRDELVKLQRNDGSWSSDGVGPVFDTSVALIILQLPYKFLPIYQR